MRIRYFADTDTAFIEFGRGLPAETRELSEDVYLDLDGDAQVVSLTIEHASRHGDLSEFSFQRIGDSAANASQVTSAT